MPVPLTSKIWQKVCCHRLPGACSLSCRLEGFLRPPTMVCDAPTGCSECVEGLIAIMKAMLRRQGKVLAPGSVPEVGNWKIWTDFP